MKKILNILTIAISVLFLQSCDDEEIRNFATERVSIAPVDSTVGIDVGGTVTTTVTVVTSTVSGSARTFDITADGTAAGAGSYVVPTSVTIPSGTNKGTIDVTLSDSNLGIGVNQLEITVGSTSTTLAGDPITISYVQNCTEVIATLDLTFDRWGSEVSWEIQDSLGGTVASGGGYGNTAAGTQTSDQIAITLCQGRSYTLITTDSYGDGWGSVGNYTLTIGGVVKVTGNGSLMFNGGNGSISSSAAFDTL